MDLSQLADLYLARPEPRNVPDTDQASRRFARLFQSDVDAYALIGGLFWQAFTQLDTYSQLLASVGLRRESQHRQEVVVVRRGYVPQGPYQSRYDLIVFDSEFVGTEPVGLAIREQPEKVADAAATYWSSLSAPARARFPGQLGGPRLVGDIIAEAARIQDFSLLVASPPQTILTAVAPAPAWEVFPQSGEGDPASAGVIATDHMHRNGVTSADHAFKQCAKEVTVLGSRGKILSRHPVSDSCFIEVPNLPRPLRQAVRGPLSGKSPGDGQAVNFCGAGSGSQSTSVTGWDKGIPFQIKPWNRLRVLTKPVTALRDSGAALLADDHYVIGFAFDRTGYDEAIEYSSWIWAEFVYQAHGLH